MKIVLSKEVMLEKLDDPILDEFVGKSRWSDQHRVVFEHEGKYYEAYYQVGSTEQQDERPWEYDDNIECTEVRKEQKVIDVWVEA